MKSNISFCYKVITFLFGVLFKNFYRGRIYGNENIPKSGGFILACNHVSHMDPPLVAVHCPRQPVYSFARSTLFKRGVCWLYNRLYMIPVDREKGADMKAIRNILSLLKSGNPVLMFPEGTRSVNGIMQRAKKGIGLFVEKACVPVVPVRIFGTFDALPKGKLWPSFKKELDIVFGRPINMDDFADCLNDEDAAQSIADKIMHAIANITKQS